MPTQLIVNADDFGYSGSVNSAVMRALREGVLTSASLMVTGDASAEAEAMAREEPELAVGLHLALTRARSVMPREVIPDLVDHGCMFSPDPVAASLRYFFNRRARRQLAWEIEAQFEMFAQTGLQLSHVDGHQHMHAHPAAARTVVELAERYGARGIRIPREPLVACRPADRSRAVYRVTVALGHVCLARALLGKLEGSRLATCDVSIGSMMSGTMGEECVIEMLGRARGKAVEVFFHPSLDETGDPYGPNPRDFAALVSPTLRRFIAERNYRLATYADIRLAGNSAMEGGHG